MLRLLADLPCLITRLFFCAIKLLFLVVVNLAAIGSSFADEGENINRILYINSYHPGYSWSDDIEKGLRERFELSDRKIELSVEYLDSRRFTEQALQTQQADVMHAKYAEYRHDLVIVSDNAAFSFASKNRQRLFPDIPVVFCGYNAFRPDVLSGLTNITGVNEEVDIEGLVETALHIKPKTRTLAFILSTGDASSKLIAEKVEASIIPNYPDQYEIVLLKDAPMTEIKETLARLPRESALFLTGQTSDTGKERALTPIENGRLISAVSPIPVYSFWNFHLGTGILGGRILSGYDQGKAAGDMARRILNGKSADSIPVLMQSPTSNIFDYTVMKRFNIAMDALPDNSIVINKPYSFYETNKKIVWITLSVFVTLIAFMIVLSLNVLSRRRAEKELKKHRHHLEQLVKKRTAELTDANKELLDSENRYRSLSDAAFEGIIIIEKGILLETNDTFCKMFGYQPSELIDKAVTDLVPPGEKERVKNKILSGYEQPYETNGLRKDGSAFPIEVHGKMLSYKGRLVRVTAIRDLTEQKKAEEEIHTLRGILPICASCKKIRDDQGYWNQIESYIVARSEVEFSHGVCPDCAKKLYPELVDEDGNFLTSKTEGTFEKS